MKVSELYVYPIKSLLGVKLDTAELTENGIAGDREFILLRYYPDGNAPKNGGNYENMQISHYSAMSLFQTSYETAQDGSGIEVIKVIKRNPADNSTQHVEMPRYPDITGLEPIEVNLHQSPVTGYDMGDKYSKWFSDMFEFKVFCVYIGPGRRTVYGNLAPNAKERNLKKQQRAAESKSWTRSITSSIASFMAPSTDTDEDDDYTIAFADVSPYLVITKESVANVSARLSDGTEMNLQKFRPNIVLEGSPGAFEEDFWSQLSVHSENELLFHLTNNCVRCPSLNVDYNTGKPGEGETGQVLKKLQVDRRLDKGAKYNPVFGRYGFLDRDNLLVGKCVVKVGDEVEVAARNEERTQIKWPGIAGPKDVLWPV